MLSLFIQAGACLSGQPSPPPRFPTIAHKDVNTSSTGHFVVEGTNSLQNMDLMVWAEELAGRVEKSTGRKLPYGPSRVIRIRVAAEGEGTVGRVRPVERLSSGGLVQVLQLGNYDRVNTSEGRDALCKLIVDGYVAYGPVATSVTGEVSTAVEPRLPGGAPIWLYRGIGQSLYPEQRARNTDVVLQLWKKGQLKPFPEIITARPKSRDYPYEAVWGLVIAWLESMPGKDELFGRLFEQLHSGGELSPVWFAGNVAGCRTSAEVDEKWENWIISQWRVVNRPGVASSLHVEQLKERLVLELGDAGMPLSSNINSRVTFRELPAMGLPAWLPNVLKNKTAELQLLGLGRGKEFSKVVDAYCAFLDSVLREKSPTRSLALLEKAEEAMIVLEKKVAATRSP